MAPSNPPLGGSLIYFCFFQRAPLALAPLVPQERRGAGAELQSPLLKGAAAAPSRWVSPIPVTSPLALRARNAPLLTLTRATKAPEPPPGGPLRQKGDRAARGLSFGGAASSRRFGMLGQGSPSCRLPERGIHSGMSFPATCAREKGCDSAGGPWWRSGVPRSGPSLLALLHPAPPGSSCAAPPSSCATPGWGRAPCHSTASLPLFSALFSLPSHSSQPLFPLPSPRGKFCTNLCPAAAFPSTRGGQSHRRPRLPLTEGKEENPKKRTPKPAVKACAGAQVCGSVLLHLFETALPASLARSLL